MVVLKYKKYPQICGYLLLQKVELIPFPWMWAGVNDLLITNRIWEKGNVWILTLHHETH